MTTVRSHPSAAFEITVGFHVDQVIVVVRGDVDVLAAPTLGAMLDVLVDQGHPHVVLDCAAVAFMDAAGLGVIAKSSARLAESGRMLTLRAAPAQTRRILDITGMNGLIRLEASDPNIAVLGAEQRSADRPVVVATDRAGLSADLARVGAKPNERDDRRRAPSCHAPGRSDRRGRRRCQRHSRAKRPPVHGGVDQRHRAADG